MKIWFKQSTLEDLIAYNLNMNPYIGVQFTELGDDFIKAKMPVDHRTMLPLGLLHGGASCVLAETLGSCASFLCIDTAHQSAVGIEINANHLRGIKAGYVVGTVKPIHVGKSIHVWDIRIQDENNDKLICISRLTTKILELDINH